MHAARPALSTSAGCVLSDPPGVTWETTHGPWVSSALGAIGLARFHRRPTGARRDVELQPCIFLLIAKVKLQANETPLLMVGERCTISRKLPLKRDMPKSSWLIRQRVCRRRAFHSQFSAVPSLALPEIRGLALLPAALNDIVNQRRLICRH